MNKPRLLFLCHRIPYPPDKGEKIRAWHFLDHLADRWAIDLGCLVDDPADAVHLPALQARCEVVMCRPLEPRRRLVRTLLGLRPGRPLTLDWFDEPGLRRWAQAGLAAGRYDAVFVYSSAMAPYAMGPAAAQRPGLRRVLDMVDVDSEKWRAYAEDGARFPKRQVWTREARTLLAFERQAVASFDVTLLVSEAERLHFMSLAPESAGRVVALDNGVDLERFAPAPRQPNPYRPEAGPALVFTGTMNYRPNVDAVCWFAQAVMPLLRTRHPTPEFHIVGAQPAPAVRALAALPGVHVTGRVPDVRPYLAHAAVAVAPLRIARGVQNKVLEAMAMARPVVASPEAFAGVRARPGRDLLVADGAEAMAQRIAEILDGRHPNLGAAARSAVMAGHAWADNLERLDGVLDGVQNRRREAVLEH